MSEVLDRINKKVEAAYKELENQHNKTKLKKLPRLQPIDVTSDNNKEPDLDTEEDKDMDKISLEDLEL